MTLSGRIPLQNTLRHGPFNPDIVKAVFTEDPWGGIIDPIIKNEIKPFHGLGRLT